MQHNPQKAKAGMLKLWASKNFANRAFYMLTGFDEVVSDKKYEKYFCQSLVFCTRNSLFTF